MSSTSRGSLALVAPVGLLDEEVAEPALPVPGRGRERRAYARLKPLELDPPVSARLKYGEMVTLVDVSAGGALFETSMALRPEADVVLEVLGLEKEDPIRVVSRVLRCQVSGLTGGIRYRGACAFKYPLTHPTIAVPVAPLLPTAAGDFLRPEFALKAIVDGYQGRSGGGGATGRSRETSTLLDSLEMLSAAAARRGDPVDRRIAELVGAVVPALRRNDRAADVLRHVQDQLRRPVPGTDAAGAAQARLLQAGQYLTMLAQAWAPAEEEEEAPELPAGWQRVVVRFVDGTLLRGYSNDFHPDRAHLHLSQDITQRASERLLVPLARLKAVFFVRDLMGNPEHVDGNVFDHVPQARKVEVTFRDGEVMVGSTLNYKPDGLGFFLTPASSRSNNVKVFVINASMLHMRFI